MAADDHEHGSSLCGRGEKLMPEVHHRAPDDLVNPAFNHFSLFGDQMPMCRRSVGR